LLPRRGNKDVQRGAANFQIADWPKKAAHEVKKGELPPSGRKNPKQESRPSATGRRQKTLDHGGKIR